MKFRSVFRGLLFASLGLLGAISYAQNNDPPGRVARLSATAGTVTFAPAGNDNWSYASLNQPFTTGDRVWADSGGRAELEIGNAILRLNARTSAEITALDDSNAQIKLTQGNFNLRVRSLAPGENIEVDTPNIAFVARTPGEYRLDVDPSSNTTQVTLRSGSAEVIGANQAVAQLNGPVSIVYRDQDLAQAAAGAPPPPDEFDQWAQARDRRIEAAQSARYVAPGTIGYADLDSYGSWRNTPDYGPVWTPTVTVSDWAPYRYGHWAWVQPWGWTWIDNAPWGFAPFHYGRWASINGSWAWVPGPVHVRPVYAPALVVFAGGNHWGASFSVGSPGVAWFPLAPGEAFRPAYHSSPNYVTNINRTVIVNNVTVNKNVYINQRSAVTAMSANNFARGQQVAHNRMQVDPGTITRSQTRAAPAVKPTAQSLRGNAPATQAAPNTQRAVITHRAMQSEAVPTMQGEHHVPSGTNGMPPQRDANPAEKSAQPSPPSPAHAPAPIRENHAAPVPHPTPSPERVEREEPHQTQHAEHAAPAQAPIARPPHEVKPQHEPAPVHQAPPEHREAPTAERHAPPAPAQHEHDGNHENHNESHKSDDRHEQSEHRSDKPKN